MHYSQDLVQRFQQHHLAKYGEAISYEEAEQELKELAGFMRIVLKREDKPSEQPAANA